jgi:sec-independent protein translocase protein TatA
MDMQLAMLNTPEIILILLFALILFGAKKLPELARGLGQGIREFKKAAQETADEFSRETRGAPPASDSALPPRAPGQDVPATATKR